MSRSPALQRHWPKEAPEEGYRIYTQRPTRALIWQPAEKWLDGAIASYGTVHAWAEQQADRRNFVGRGRVFSVPAPVAGPDSADRWAVRHFHRGGALSMHMRDRYLRVGRRRPIRELAASVAARARGIKTPAVICAITYEDGIYYRADLITEVIPGAKTLAHTLLEHDGTLAWLIAMRQAGEVIQALTELGVHHVDLNAHNIVLTSGATPEAYVVDLDRARILRKPSFSARDQMLARLTRSIVKIGTPTGEKLTESEILAALDHPSTTR
jgi:3-deoxy-D-manno-octulosonic acid kinase